MTHKEKADQQASPQNTHAKYSTHTNELELLLVDQLHIAERISLAGGVV